MPPDINLSGHYRQLTGASSVAHIIRFPVTDKPCFAETWRAYRSAILDLPLTNAEFRFATEFCTYFSKQHFEVTGELIAWPSWTTLMSKTGLCKMTVHSTIKKFERMGAIEVERHLYNHTRKKRAHNIYHVPATFLTLSLRKR